MTKTKTSSIPELIAARMVLIDKRKRILVQLDEVTVELEKLGVGFSGLRFRTNSKLQVCVRCGEGPFTARSMRLHKPRCQGPKPKRQPVQR